MNINPKWVDCPEWVRYFAIDSNGWGFYYEFEPEIHPIHNSWFNSFTGRRYFAGHFDPIEWKKSLIQRPN